MNFRVSTRDRRITRRVLQGESCRQVAEDYGVGTARVRQITLATVARLYPYAAALTGLGLLRLRQHAGALLIGLDLDAPEEG
jgi:hypothetical protein